LARFKQGGDKAGEPLILDNEAKFQPFQMTSVEAQTLESRGLQVEEICRTFRVMPIMVGHSDKAATYASAEQMFLAHVVHCLMPWYERWCTSADVNLLSEQDRREGYYTKLNPNALMRGASKDRAEFYSKALGAGGTAAWMKQDEIRGLEELDPDGRQSRRAARGRRSRQPAAMRHSEFNLGEIKFAAGDGAEARTFSGYGAVFNNVDSYGDVIDPGAFKKTLSEAKKSDAWPAMLLQHGGFGFNADDMTPIGIWTEMDEDENGLKITGKLADTQRGNEVYGC
jgi:hypothetical protein